MPSTKKPKPVEDELNRPETTLFLINSVDGRVTSHDSDDLDPDKNWKRDPRIGALIQPFFEFAKGNIHTLTYGDVMADIGVNNRTSQPQRLNVNLIVIDHPQHLTVQGIKYTASNFKSLYLVCLKSHPIVKAPDLPKNLRLISQSRRLDLPRLMRLLKSKYKIKQVSIQSNSRLNARWLSSGVVDHLSVIISPLLVGRHGTPSLIDQDLLSVKPLLLAGAKPFGFNFVNLRYDVVND